MMIKTHHASLKNQGIIRVSYAKYKKRLNIVKSPKDWFDGLGIALNNMNEQMGITKDKLEKSKKLGYDYFLTGNGYTKCRYVIGVTSMYIICRLEGEYVTIKDFSNKSNVSKVSISRCLRDMVEKLNINGEIVE